MLSELPYRRMKWLFVFGIPLLVGAAFYGRLGLYIRIGLYGHSQKTRLALALGVGLLTLALTLTAGVWRPGNALVVVVVYTMAMALYIGGVTFIATRRKVR